MLSLKYPHDAYVGLAPFTTTLEVLVAFNPSLSVTVSSNKYELALTSPTTFGAVNVATDVSLRSSKTDGASSSESSMPHA
jgi:hypothetical protein